MIHQVFGVFNDGTTLEDIPIFHQQVSKTQQFCQTNDIIYKMWDNEACNELINKYPEYKELYENFRFPIQKADFIRYLILYDTGGIYVDCDIAPIADINNLFEMNEFFVVWHNDKKLLPYNAVLGSVPNSELYKDILKHIEESYIEKSSMDIYTTWVGRFIFHTTGHYMLKRVLKRYPDIQFLDILKINSKQGTIIQGESPLFEDYNCSTWFNSKNK